MGNFHLCVSRAHLPAPPDGALVTGDSIAEEHARMRAAYQARSAASATIAGAWRRSRARRALRLVANSDGMFSRGSPDCAVDLYFSTAKGLWDLEGMLSDVKIIARERHAVAVAHGELACNL